MAMFADADAYQDWMGRYADLLAPEFAAAAGVAPGQRVLDVGCGSGSLTALLAGIVGAENVAGADPSEPFVEAARRRVPGADLRVAPAESLPFDDGTFDVTVAQLVFHFVSDPAGAAAEMARVTRPGGRIGATAWDWTGGMVLFRVYWEAALEVDPATAVDDRQYGGTPGQLADLFREAGLRDVTDRALTVTRRYGSFDELWASITAGVGTIGTHTAGLSDDQARTVAAALRRRLGDPDGPIDLDATAWCAVGTV